MVLSHDCSFSFDELEANDDEAVFDFTESPEGDSITISAKEPVAEPVAEDTALKVSAAKV